MTEVQNTPTPVAPPLTDHFHTVPHWTHTRLVSQLGVVVECIEASVVLWWAFGVLGSTPAHSWLLNRHTVFWKSDGHTEINRARWHAPFAQCVEAFVATERPRGCLMDISRGFDCTVISLWSEFCKRLQPLSPDWSYSWFLWAGPPVFSFLSVNLWGNVQQIWP